MHSHRIWARKALGHRPRDRDPGSVTKIAPNRSRHVQVFVGAYIRVIDHRAARALTQRLADQGIERHKPRHGLAGANRSDPLMSHRCLRAAPLPTIGMAVSGRDQRSLSTRPLIFSSHCQSTARMPLRPVVQGPHFSGLQRNSLWPYLGTHATDSVRNARIHAWVRARARPVS